MTTTRRVLRYSVAVDDRWHNLEIGGRLVHVDTRSPDVVELWVDCWVDDEVQPAAPTLRSFRVFATGQPIPGGAVHRGTVMALGGQLVWHLFEQTG